MKRINKWIWILACFAGIDWIIIGFFQFDIIKMFFGGMAVANIIYILLGMCAMYVSLVFRTMQKQQPKKKKEKEVTAEAEAKVEEGV